MWETGQEKTEVGGQWSEDGLKAEDYPKRINRPLCSRRKGRRTEEGKRRKSQVKRGLKSNTLCDIINYIL